MDSGRDAHIFFFPLFVIFHCTKLFFTCITPNQLHILHQTTHDDKQGFSGVR